MDTEADDYRRDFKTPILNIHLGRLGILGIKAAKAGAEVSNDLIFVKSTVLGAALEIEPSKVVENLETVMTMFHAVMTDIDTAREVLQRLIDDA